MAAVPILLNSCARAATAAEARYRIDYPIAPSRATRVIALDRGAGPTLRAVAAQAWANARFFLACPPPGRTESPPEAGLWTIGGQPIPLDDQLDGASGVVMLATSDAAAAAATAIGTACTRRGIMTAGLILGQRTEVNAAVSALRPHARVLMVTEDQHDVAEVLTALRA